MRVVRSIAQMSGVSQKIKCIGRTIGFVPTMGALHEGHLSLIRRARKDNDMTIVSIFVNTIQFGPKEDFKRYPRPISQDIRLCRKEKVDFIFYPDASRMYSGDPKTYINVEDLSQVLCGKSRPGHFRGVTTVVAKLFNIIRPDVAYFGGKDAQQAIIIKKMTEELNFPIRIKIMPTIREKDGLAMSSRNAYLSKEERKDALVLSQALRLAGELIKAGVKDANKLIARMRQLISKKKSARIDYIAFVDSDTLKPVGRVYNNCLLALAVWIGNVRLIDNARIKNA